MNRKGIVFSGLGLGAIALVYFSWTEHVEKKQPFPKWQKKNNHAQIPQRPAKGQQPSVKKVKPRSVEAATSKLMTAKKIVFTRSKENSNSEKIFNQQSDIRDFVMPEKYPGYNMEVFEEKKLDFLIQQLKLFPGDAAEVLERYQLSLQESNHAMRTQSEKAMEKISTITGEYEAWLRGKLGDEDFLKYNEFVKSSMSNLQQRIKAYQKVQKQQLGN